MKAYPNDEKITTTLTSGKVEVSIHAQPPHIPVSYTHLDVYKRQGPGYSIHYS